MKRTILGAFFCLLCSLSMNAQRIAVIDFNAGVGISQADVDGISAIFNTYFSPAGYTLVERSRIDRVIDEQQFQRGRLTEQQMVKIGQILNISQIVVGDVNIVMNQYNVDVRVLNVQSGTIAAKDGATWTPGSSYRNMMSQLASRLASMIAIEPTPSVPVQPAQPTEPVSKNGTVISPDGMEMVYVEGPGGIMGVKSFYIGKYEVTQAQWKAVMGTNPSHFSGENNPVEQVSWNDCQEFIKKLNALTGRTYRLPTSAEWEYAARSGKARDTYEYAGSNNLDEVAWYKSNSGDRTHQVGTKKPNSLGIYDMTGNVWEWCEDWYDSSQSYRVARGGSWYLSASSCRVSYRSNSSPGFRHSNLGFRVVLVP